MQFPSSDFCNNAGQSVLSKRIRVVSFLLEITYVEFKLNINDYILVDIFDHHNKGNACQK